MCGRYVSTFSTDELVRGFDVLETYGDDLAPSYNVAPTQRVRMVAERVSGPEPGTARHTGSGRSSSGYDGQDSAPADAPIRQLRTVRWGLVPHWAKDRKIGTRMINARSETVAQKPSFKAAAARRRCLVPANGYYEWEGERGHKTPYFLHDPDSGMLAMAGLYEIWRDPELPDDHEGALLWTCTVITRSAPDALGHIHDRSPVLVPEDMRADWLDCSDEDAGVADALLSAMPPPNLEPREVGKAVGNVRNNSPELIEPVG